MCARVLGIYKPFVITTATETGCAPWYDVSWSQTMDCFYANAGALAKRRMPARVLGGRGKRAGPRTGGM